MQNEHLKIFSQSISTQMKLSTLVSFIFGALCYFHFSKTSVYTEAILPYIYVFFLLLLFNVA